MRLNLHTMKAGLVRSSPTLLSLTAIGGTIATGILAARGAVKAYKEMEYAKSQKGKLTRFEKAMISAPYYIPAIAAATGTSLCILGANALNKRQQGKLVSAYAALQGSYIALQEKIHEKHSTNIQDEIIKEKLADHEFTESDLPWFYEPFTGTLFQAEEEFVKDAFNKTNEALAKREYTSLAEYLEHLEIEEYDIPADILGWDKSKLIEEWDAKWIDFWYYKPADEDYYIIQCDQVPILDECLFPQCRDVYLQEVLAK